MCADGRGLSPPRAGALGLLSTRLATAPALCSQGHVSDCPAGEDAPPPLGLRNGLSGLLLGRLECAVWTPPPAERFLLVCIRVFLVNDLKRGFASGTTKSKGGAPWAAGSVLEWPPSAAAPHPEARSLGKAPVALCLPPDTARAHVCTLMHMRN